MINTYNLFAVHVIHTKFIVPTNLHNKIIDYVNKNYVVSDVEKSCVNGFQTHENFDGKEDLNNMLQTYLNNTFKLNLENGWLNVLGKNSYNRPHVHSGTDITYSAVLYLSADNNNITFTKDGEIFDINPKLFDLLIFPFNLVHYVLPEERNQKRVCYSFNLSTIGE